MIDNSPIFISLDEVKGETTGHIYSGEFRVVKYLTHQEVAEAGREAERLLRGIERNNFLISFYSCLARLKFHVADGPDWWKASKGGLTLLDKEPVWVLSEKLNIIQLPEKEETEEGLEEKDLEKAEES